MVAHKVQRVGRDGLGGDEALGWFAIIREFQEVEHVWVLFGLDRGPGFFGDVVEGAADGAVPEFPADAWCLVSLASEDGKGGVRSGEGFVV